MQINLSQFSGLSLDSRTTEKNNLFFTRGNNIDENTQYINEAISKGATGIVGAVGLLPENISVPFWTVENLGKTIGELSSEFYGHPSRDLIVIGVTGTNGKTSCTHYIAQALKFLGCRCGVIGTNGYGFLDKLTPGFHTTPDAPALHQQFKLLRDQGAKYVAMEVSSHALEQQRVAGISFDVGVFTNLSRDHLDYHGDMASYGAAKRLLFDQPGMKTAVVNLDDEFGVRLFSDLKNKLNVIGYGIDHEMRDGLITATKLHFKPNGVVAEIDSPWGDVEIETELLGQFNFLNMMAVTGVLCSLDFMFENVMHAATQFQAVPGRMQRFQKGDSALIVVDYAHTPDALEKALQALRAHNQGKLWCVFGCGGERDKGKRPLMGKIAESLADVLVITDDNSRFEAPTQITDEILAGLKKPNKAKVINDRSEAIAHAVDQASAGDIVLIAGKGHEDYQEIKGERLPMSDVEIVRGLLAKLVDG